jgi:DNA mismatch endonuclease, patch repair protein
VDGVAPHRFDRLSAEERSALMARIRGRDTAPEVRLRALLHAMGYRFRIHRADLPGTPDVVLPARGKVLFLHGCFWHRHTGCRHATVPRTRTEFWHEKFARNLARDRRVRRALNRAGWSVGVVWECALRDEASLERRLLRFLGPPGRPLNPVAR